jgi:hypothetical protein
MIWYLLAAANVAELPRSERRRLCSSRSNAIHRQEVSLAFVKKERWTEDEIVSLPMGEHDYFERKAGALVDAGGNNLLDDLAKAASAFANSGGGHLVLGVTDSGRFDGVRSIYSGRTTTRDWLEQKIPELLDYRLNDFRVHTVDRSAESSIPAGRDVLVVDFGDSALAPHQSRRHIAYFYRSAGRSNRAPHFYLELLRQRQTGVDLEASLGGAEIEAGWEHEGFLYIRICMRMKVHNRGRVAAYKWGLLPRQLHNHADGRADDYFFVAVPGAPGRNSKLSLDSTVLPGCDEFQEKIMSVRLRPANRTSEAIRDDVLQMLGDIEITFQLPTETSQGHLTKIGIGAYIDFDRLDRVLGQWIDR